MSVFFTMDLCGDLQAHYLIFFYKKKIKKGNIIIKIERTVDFYK